MASPIAFLLAFLSFWRAAADQDHCHDAACEFDADLNKSGVVLLQRRSQTQLSGSRPGASAPTQLGSLLGLASIQRSSAVHGGALPADCVGRSTPEDEKRPIKEVLAERGNPDGFCYFQNAVFYVTPSDENDFRKRGQSGVDWLQGWDLTCPQPYHEGSGRPVTWYGDWGEVSTDNLDCNFYSQDLIYCYTFGWLRNQHLDSSLIVNHTAWVELAGTECDNMQKKFQFADEEVTIVAMKRENDETGNIGKGVACSQDPNCVKPITSRELAAHVYPKCLMSLEYGAASEMAYCQQLGCVLPGQQTPKIGTGSQCEPL